MGRPRAVCHPAIRDLGWWFYEHRRRVRQRLDRAVERVEEARSASAQRQATAEIVCITRGTDVGSGRRIY